MNRGLALRLLGYQWVAVLIQAVISFGLSIIVARKLEPDQFGVYAIATSAGVFVSLFLEGGFNSLLQRESAKRSLPEAFAHSLPSYAMGYSLWISAALFVLAFINPFGQDQKTLLSILCAYLPLVLIHFSMYVLRGQGRLAKDAFLQVLMRSATAFAVLLTLMFGFQTPAAILFAQGAGAAFIYFLLLYKVRIVPKFSLPRSLMRVAAPIMLLAFVGAIANRSDLLICRVLDIPRGDVGNYGVALRLVEAAQVFAGPVGFILLRRFRLNEFDKAVFLSAISSNARFAMMVGFGAFVISLMFADVVIPLLFGPMYSAAGSLLEVLSAGLIFFFGNIVLSQATMALELERWSVIGTLGAALGNVIFNFTLLPIYGVMASAWVALVTQMFLMVWLFLGIRRSLIGGTS